MGLFTLLLKIMVLFQLYFFRGAVNINVKCILYIFITYIIFLKKNVIYVCMSHIYLFYIYIYNIFLRKNRVAMYLFGIIKGRLITQKNWANCCLSCL